VPCIACNRQIKFADLLHTARQLGAQALATGHYVASRATPAGRRALYRARDAERDQSYFLFGTSFEELAFLRFPLGEMTKAEVRALARDWNLAIADKHDSQDICFVPEGRYTEVIARLQPTAAEPGEIVDLAGRVLGRHPGIVHYTVGQRRGIGVPSREALFVIELDAVRRRVVVGPRAALATRRIRISDLNWIGDPLPEEAARDGLPVFVRVRSTRPPQPAQLFVRGADADVEIARGEEAVAPGQACVIYENGAPRARVLGGGTIRTSARRPEPQTPLYAAG
jgi:tRNA-uridine 2-sulfurtransferase